MTKQEIIKLLNELRENYRIVFELIGYDYEDLKKADNRIVEINNKLIELGEK